MNPFVYVGIFLGVFVVCVIVVSLIYSGSLEGMCARNVFADGVRMSAMSRENDNPMFDLARDKKSSGSFGQEITQGIL